MEDRCTPTTVTLTTDVVDANDNKISLREAVAAFNADPDAFGANNISFDAALKGATFVLTGGELAITGKAGATNTELTLLNSDATELTISGNNTSRLFNVSAGVGLSIGNGFHLTQGKAAKGGAIFSAGTVTLSGSRVTNNKADEGGGIYNDTSGKLTVNGSVIENNQAGAGNGGGILDNGSTGISITNSLLRANFATGDGGGVLGGNVTLVNTTVSGNIANGDGGGTWTNGTLVSINSTIVLNTADGDGDGTGLGGVFLESTPPAGTAVMFNTLIGGNTAGNSLGKTPPPSDVRGSLVGTGSNCKFNLIADPATAGGLTDGVNGNIIGVSGAAIPIGDLINNTAASNGGTGAPTHALVAGSLALDRGDKTLSLFPGTTTPIPSDQRVAWSANVAKAAARVAGPQVDIGAFELQNVPPLITTPTVAINLVEDGAGFAFTGAGNTITVADDAFAAPNYAVTLAVPNGKLTLGVVTGLTGLTGNGTKEIKFNASQLTDLNTALGSLRFDQSPNQYGTLTLEVTVDDCDAGAPGGAQGGFTGVNIAIAAAIDTPSVTSPVTNKDTPVEVVFARSAVDGAEITHFKVSNLVGGVLTYTTSPLGGGTKTIVVDAATLMSGSFVLLEPDAKSVLTFTPNLGFVGVASFDIQAGLGQYNGDPQTPTFNGPVVTSTITVGGTGGGDTAPPTAALTAAPNVTNASNLTQYDFTVTFTDNVAINVTTIDGADVRITGPNGFNQLATLVSVDKTNNGTPRVATYRITAPGGTWDLADNGTYTIALEAGQVADTSGFFAGAGALGTFTAQLTSTGGGGDTQAPTAAVGSAPPVGDASKSATTYDFTIVYTDNVAVNATTFDGLDIRVFGPNGFNQLATFVGTSVPGNGTPRTVTYRITAPGGTWDAADNGNYTIAMMPSQVADTSGNFVAAATTLGTFTATLSGAVADTQAPTATVDAASLADGAKGVTTYTFNVTYADNVSVNAGTFDGQDIRVTGPNGFNQLATFVSATPAGNGTPRTATYRITAPGGSWDFAVNGTYTISLEAGQVADTSGNVAAATTLGTFAVNLTPDPTRVGYSQFAVGSDRGITAQVQFYNADQSPRLNNPLMFAGFTGGARVAAADFNNDGVAELILGSGPGSVTQVVVLDGKTLTTLLNIQPFEASFTGGEYVATGDLNGDGFPELLITPDEGGGPRVRVFLGNGFIQLADFFGIEDVNFRGGARAAVGDITGDGKADLVVAAGFGGGPRIGVFDGAKVASEGNLPDNQSFSRWNTWKPFGDFLAFEPALRNGVFVAVGDLNGDRFADLIAGGGPGGGPRITAFSGQALLTNTQTPLVNFFAGDVNNRGGIRVAVKNLDGDAKADLVVGSGPGGGSRVTAYLGATILAAEPPTTFAFDAIANFTGGVFVG